MHAAINLPTTGTIPEPCSTISATRTSSTPSDTPSFHRTGSATSGEISVDWRPSPAPRVGTGTVRRMSNELGCACGRRDPPVGGLLDSENCSCPLSQKPVQKRFLPQQRGSLSVEGVFAKKIFRCGRGFRCRRLRSAAVTRLWPRLGLRRGWCIHIAWLSGHVSPPATRSRRTRAAALPRSAAAKQDCAFGPLAIPTPEPHIACAALIP
jgi:hypothetical protein